MQLNQPGPLLNPLHIVNAPTFLCYRRDGTQAITNLIYSRLDAWYGSEYVFLDCINIPLATDFRQDVTRWIQKCAMVMFVIIGQDWVNLKSKRQPGVRKIDQADDPVRQEIELAQKHDLLIIPVLVDGADMPDAADLPESIRFLSSLNGRRLRMDIRSFDHDLQQLYTDTIGVLRQRSADKVRQNRLSPQRRLKLDYYAGRHEAAEPKSEAAEELPQTRLIRTRLRPSQTALREPIFRMVTEGRVTVMQVGNGSRPSTPVEIDVPMTYFADYPVTNADFAAFVSDKQHGYSSPKVWQFSDEAAYWFKYNGLPSQPVSSYGLYPCAWVNWYEAVAFTRWCSQILSRKVTLPTEGQMRRMLDLSVPRGSTDRLDLANTLECGIGHATPVTQFAADRSGLSDTFGNVQTWCRTVSGKPQTKSLNGRYPRAISGGAYCLPRAAIRQAGSSDPAARYAHVGLRLVLADG